VVFDVQETVAGDKDYYRGKRICRWTWSDWVHTSSTGAADSSMSCSV